MDLFFDPHSRASCYGISHTGFPFYSSSLQKPFLVIQSEKKNIIGGVELTPGGCNLEPAQGLSQSSTV